MIKKRYNLWQEGEYTYSMSFGFQPNIVSYLHENDGELRPCIIVVPGGGYRVVSPTEGEIVAKDFYDKGYQAFVCTYTVNITGAEPLRDQPMKDLARALRYIRKHADKFCVNPKQLVVCGFSAGGHLCGSLCVHYMDIKEENSEYDEFSARPDAGILCYPVITTNQYVGGDSFTMLFGKEPSPEELEYASLEKQVKENTPPCFLWQTTTDEVVPVENTYLMAKALKEKKIPYAQHIFTNGIHGSSLANDIWASGNFGEPYTLEQGLKLAELVKDGVIPCSEGEKKQLLEAFDYGEKSSERKITKNIPNKEVEIWPKLADLWLCEIL